jgi:hypothetical protein
MSEIRRYDIDGAHEAKTQAHAEEQRDRRYRYTIEVIDFVGNHVPTADYMVAATSDGRWEISDRDWGVITTVDSVAEAVMRIGERIGNLIKLEAPF